MEKNIQFAKMKEKREMIKHRVQTIMQEQEMMSLKSFATSVKQTEQNQDKLKDKHRQTIDFSRQL